MLQNARGSVRAVLGVFSFVPAAAVIGFFVSFYLMASEATHGGDTIARNLNWVLGAPFVGYFVGYPLVVIYCVDAWRRPEVPPEQKGLWTLLLLALMPFALPTYWLTVVQRKTRAASEAPDEKEEGTIQRPRS